MSPDAIRRAPLAALAEVIGGRSYPDEMRTDDPQGSIEIVGDREWRITDWRPHRVPRTAIGPRDVTVTEGDLVIGLNVPASNAVLIDAGDRLVDTRHAVLRPTKGSPATTEWLFVWASSSEFRDQIATRARTLRSRISIQELRTFTVPLPSRDRQVQAFEDLQALETATRLAHRQLDLLVQLRSAMADRAVAVAMTEAGPR